MTTAAQHTRVGGRAAVVLTRRLAVDLARTSTATCRRAPLVV
ncbi:hypothetical protein [Pseudonocardia oroxyli]|nr:hypothetical protein [Pseudonocardia oroxyli]